MNGKVPEFSIQRVDAAHRVVVPKTLCKQLDWIDGNEPLTGWLLLGSHGRCRLLSAAQGDSDAQIQSVRERIASELGANDGTLEFRDDRYEALAFRLLPVNLTPPGPGWRLTLPRAIAAIMQIRPGETDVALLLLHGHLEIWTMETLRTAVSVPLPSLI